MLLLITTWHSVFFVADAQSCTACNCQLNNVQVLRELLKAEVNGALADEPREIIILRCHMSLSITICT